VPWTYRLGQGLAAILAGAAVSAYLRRSEHACWLAPAMVIAVRLTLDPLMYDYYQVPLVLLPAAGLAALLTGALDRPRATAAVATAAAVLMPPVAVSVFVSPLSSAGPACVALAVGVIAVGTRATWCEREAVDPACILRSDAEREGRLAD
jgi:hypothetical protein